MLATHRSHIPSSSSPLPHLSFDKSFLPSMSPSKSTHAGRRPSLSSPMSWLSRTSSSTSQTTAYSAASKPIRISEPKLSASIRSLSKPRSRRSRVLGTGALVVRTPREALAGSGVTYDSDSDPGDLDEKRPVDDEGEELDDDEDEDDEDDCGALDSGKALSSYSPPLPPLPPSKASSVLPLKEASPSRPNRPTRPPPPSTEPPIRPVLKRTSPSNSSDFSPPVPPVPSSLSPLPPFECILVSPAPSGAIDASKIIVTLETCTATHKTTLSTLTSRPSHLADYLKSLLQPGRDSDAVSVHSRTSEYFCSTPDTAFNSIFHNHLTASGLIPHFASSIHIFLDRPSAPYVFLSQ